MRWSRWIVLCSAAIASVAVAGPKPQAPTAKPQAPTAKAPAPAAPAAAADLAGSGAITVGSVTVGSAADGSAEEMIPHLVGPKLVDLGHGAEIDVPAGMIMLERVEAQQLVRKSGDDSENVAAVILPPATSDATWAVVIDAIDAGYVSDSDSDDLDANSMFESFQKGNEEQNKKRAAMGVGPLVLDGWSEKPVYDKLQHHLVWGLNGHGPDGKVVNFFTRFLGRNGYISVNLIDAPEKIEASKAQAISILNALHFKDGSRYEDHASGDKDSGFGLKALIIGGGAVLVAKKTGILIAILIALKKGVILVVAGIAAFFRRIFGKKKASAPIVSTSAPPVPPSPPADGVPPPADVTPPSSDPPSSDLPPHDPGSDPPAGA